MSAKPVADLPRAGGIPDRHRTEDYAVPFGDHHGRSAGHPSRKKKRKAENEQRKSLRKEVKEPLKGQTTRRVLSGKSRVEILVLSSGNRTYKPIRGRSRLEQLVKEQETPNTSLCEGKGILDGGRDLCDMKTTASKTSFKDSHASKEEHPMQSGRVDCRMRGQPESLRDDVLGGWQKPKKKRSCSIWGKTFLEREGKKAAGGKYLKEHLVDQCIQNRQSSTQVVTQRSLEKCPRLRTWNNRGSCVAKRERNMPIYKKALG